MDSPDSLEKVVFHSQINKCSARVCPGNCRPLNSPGFSLLNLFSQFCLLRDFRTERAKVPLPAAELSQSQEWACYWAFVMEISVLPS